MENNTKKCGECEGTMEKIDADTAKCNNCGEVTNTAEDAGELPKDDSAKSSAE